MEKFAIIMSGGGMKSSFGVGAILALAKEDGGTEPDLLICGSGNAGTGSYYVSKQYDSIRNIWTNLVSSNKFVNMKRFWKMIDIDYLIDEIFKKQDVLKEGLVYKSKTKYLIPAYNKRTGKIDYFDNNGKVNIFEGMRATKAMPIAFRINPKVKVGDSVYCDTLLSSKAETHIKKAVELGANKILIINNLSENKKGLQSLLFSIWMLFQKNRKGYLREVKELSNYDLPKGVQVFRLSPKSKLKIKILQNDSKSLHETIEQGYHETLENKGLREFLG